jgi:hypothetical protein
LYFAVKSQGDKDSQQDGYAGELPPVHSGKCATSGCTNVFIKNRFLSTSGIDWTAKKQQPNLYFS